jgi:hypothetical protein
MFREGLNLITVFLIGWFVISLMGFLLIGWSFLQNSVYDSGLRSGLERGAGQASAQIYNDIINKAANDECNTVFIQYDGRRVDLINVQCLQTLSAPEADAGAAVDENRG